MLFKNDVKAQRQYDTPDSYYLVGIDFHRGCALKISDKFNDQFKAA
jgi:hypothetical protein